MTLCNVVFTFRRFVLSRVEIILSRAIGSSETIEFVAEGNSMKRTRAATRIQQEDKIEKNKDNEDTVISERPKLNLKSLRNQEYRDTENVYNTTDSQISVSSKSSKKSQKEPKMETHIERNKRKVEKLEPNTNTSKGKPRAVVDLEMMKLELSQLEDPPMTPSEKELSSGRLQYEFFDIPCEELAQRLLGKILVRYFENGTILKGRIVETEGYLGAIDKASHSYQNRITPRNLPMYMSPGTIYIYMTYGMYHCFNISSQEGNAHVLIKAVEPLMGLEYMELLKNMRWKDNRRENQTARLATHLKQYKLCNNPFKICDAFAIDQNSFDRKFAYACNNLWLESQPFVRPPTIVAIPSENLKSDDSYVIKTRYYVLGSTSVNEKNSECEKLAYIPQ
ncbi:PREDICTED: DNA-3-methyladenine glycosylase-like isoform X2 [Trachymyrmex septentrionalis]|uniref:DNA-3-methyladenine glycosylase-like isoform X2 n=1 Tax=Trachymyrmex septentrionalis TaxID=34720 RepID=UPI00084F35CD|nr:PREDICTED: DNA-3-methyladenine glycosylase-like isoform X2 [Trachymyrmex septentrionalis]